MPTQHERCDLSAKGWIPDAPPGECYDIRFEYERLPDGNYVYINEVFFQGYDHRQTQSEHFLDACREAALSHLRTLPTQEAIDRDCAATHAEA